MHNKDIRESKTETGTCTIKTSGSQGQKPEHARKKHKEAKVETEKSMLKIAGRERQKPAHAR